VLLLPALTISSARLGTYIAIFALPNKRILCSSAQIGRRTRAEVLLWRRSNNHVPSSGCVVGKPYIIGLRQSCPSSIQ
jgi:hypothetical protein